MSKLKFTDTQGDWVRVTKLEESVEIEFSVDVADRENVTTVMVFNKDHVPQFRQILAALESLD